MELQSIFEQVKTASLSLTSLDTTAIDAILTDVADEAIARKDEILRANALESAWIRPTRCTTG